MPPETPEEIRASDVGSIESVLGEPEALETEAAPHAEPKTEAERLVELESREAAVTEAEEKLTKEKTTEPEAETEGRDMSREERATGNAPLESGLDKNSREYHALHGWPPDEGD